MARRAEVVVLCEDEQQWNLVRRALLAAGFDDRKIRRKAAPRGSGAAEQWVRERFAAEREELRRRRNRVTAAWLVAVIDADLRTVHDRLVAIGVERTSTDLDHVVSLVPRRNVETWLRALRDEWPTDEETDYKRPASRPTSAKDEARGFVELCRSPEPSHPLPSLARGVQVARPLILGRSPS